MLRRVARALRFLLVIFALAILGWLPFSFFYQAYAEFRHASQTFIVTSSGGAVAVGVLDYRGREGDTGIRRMPRWPSGFAKDLRRAAFGRYRVSPDFAVAIPLWLLSARCLAWPVTSFIVHRRRRRRGFAVEAVGNGEVVSEER